MLDYLSSVYNAIVVFFGAVVGFLFGGINGTLIVLICFIVLDFITGFLCGIVEKKLSSNTAFRGIIRKFFEILIVSAGHLLDVYVLGEGSVVFTAACFLFISTEGISLLENASRLGVPIPKKVFEVLSQLKVTAGGSITNIDTDVKEPTNAEKEKVNNDSLSSNK